MDWATKRKLEYFIIIVLAILMFVVLPFYLWIYQAPTCFDGRKNGGETGVDCGGNCRLLCPNEILEPQVKWDPRAFKVTGDQYSLLAYIENPNVSAEVISAPYTFKVYDSSGSLIVEKNGNTTIPRGKDFAVFDGNISLGNRNPSKVTFEFGNLVWTRTLVEDPEISVENKALMKEETTPRVEATVKNLSLASISNLELVVIIFDGGGNAIATSRTFIPRLNSAESTDVVFTWPEPFVTKAQVCENPVSIALAIDRSGSMDDLGTNPPQPLTDVKNAAVYFLNLLHKADRAALVSFANVATIDQSLSGDTSLTTKSVDKVSIASTGTQNTNIADGLIKSNQALAKSSAEDKKVIILLTDGVPTVPEKSGDSNYPENYAKEISSGIREDGTEIYAIGLGDNVNEGFLQEISSDSQAFLAPEASKLREIYKNIATKICTARPARIEIYPRFLNK